MKPIRGRHHLRLKAVFRIILILIVSTYCLAMGEVMAAAQSDGAMDKITLQLRWKHQFQFAGYYAAQEKGFYAEEGLDVHFKERIPSKDHVQSVLDGEADYGTDDATLLLKRLQGKPVVLLAQIFQHSPLVLLSKQGSGIISPFEMVGKKVMYDSRDAPINSMFLETLGSLEKIRKVHHTMDFNDFIQGHVDVISAYITDQPYYLKQRGVRLNIINPQSYGIDFYGDNLFTTTREIREHPERVLKMRHASLKGWTYALKHQDEIIGLIQKKYNPNADRDHLEFEARMTEMMILPDLIELGSFNDRRFDRIAELYARLGIAGHSQVPDQFFFKGPAENSFYLTQKERKWLTEHREIEIGTMDAWPPLNYIDSNRIPKGIGADYVKAMNKRLNNVLKIVPAHFETNYKAVKNKQRPALMDITRRAEREPFFHFTTPYIKIPHVIVGRSDGPYFGSEKALSGRVIALERGFYNVTYFEKHYPEIKIREYDSTRAALGAVLKKEADAYVGNRTVAAYLMAQDRITGLELQGRSTKQPVELSIGVRKDWPILARILNRALASLTLEEESRIWRKWLSQSGELVALSAAERAWIKKHPLITVHNEMDAVPFNFNENGIPKGFSIEYMDLVAKKVGLRVQYNTGSWNALLDMVKANTLDVMLNIARSKEREDFLRFSKSYYSTLLSLFVRDNIGKIETIEDLYGKTVAVPKGSHVETLIKRHPKIQIYPVKNTKEAVIAASTGNADALFNIVTVVNYHIKELMIQNLRLNGEVGLSDGKPMQMHIAVHKDNKMLASIIDKGLAAIDQREIAVLRSKWLGMKRKEDEKSISLTTEEQAWLARHPVVRVSNEMDFPPFDFAVGGKPQGYSIDLLNLMATKIGLNIQYVNGYTWKELVELFKDHELELLHSLVKTPARENFGLFSNDYHRSKQFFVTRIENPELSNFSDLFGKTVAVGKAWKSEKFIAANYPQVNLLRLNGLEEMLEAVSKGEAYATLANVSALQYMIKKKGMMDLKLAGWAKELDQGRTHNYYFMAQKSAPELVSMLNKALAILTTKERHDLEEKWFGSPGTIGVRVALTQQERAYLDRKGAIKMSVLPDWLPYERITEDGRHEGIGQEMIQLIAKRIGTPIELVPTREWGESLQNLRERRCDILPIAMDVPSRRDAMLFTKPYIVEPFVIATRSEELFIRDAGEIGNRKIGIIKSYAFTEVFKLKYPDLQIIEVANAKDGLEQVSRGQLFGYIDSMPTIAYTMQKHSMLDLKIAGKMEFNLELTIACRKDEPLLVSIMQKGADAITQEERRQIISKWLSVRFEQGFDYTLFWQILAGMAVLFFVTLFWNRHLSDMNRQIKQANQEAQAANRTKSDFLANMSHEIRTPLNAITGFSELLSSTVKDEKQKSYLEAIKNSGKNLMLLINDILDLSKIEAGKMNLEYSAVDLKALVLEVEQVFALQAAKKQIRFIVDIGQDLPQAMHLDEIRLRQVLLNLVGNAVKFTDGGYIKLSVRLVRREADGLNDIWISVEDTGIGIARKDMDSIFESFKQQSGQDNFRYGGTGLGLAICKRLVEMMNGRIEVESTPGNGSIFRMIIRDVAGVSKEALPKKIKTDLTRVRFEKGRVLVVDDVESNRMFLRELLEKMELEVLEAQNGHEAAIITPEYRPDLILMDIRMPVMDGFAAAALLKRDEKSADIPILAVTASSPSLNLSRLKEKGFNGFISKPVEIQQLVSELYTYFKPVRQAEDLPGDDGGEDPAQPEFLSSKGQANLPEVLGILEAEFRARWDEFQTRQPIRVVRRFAEQLIELGQNYEVGMVMAFGEQLLIQADNFDVNKMKETLEGFPELIEKLTRLKEVDDGTK